MFMPGQSGEHIFNNRQTQRSGHICQGGVAGHPRGLWIPRPGFESRPWPDYGNFQSLSFLAPLLQRTVMYYPMLFERW